MMDAINPTSAIEHLLSYGFYPAWLAAGLADYIAHRRSHIESTAGVIESSLHVAEFISMALWLFLIALFEPTWSMLFVSALLVGLHTALTYIDVRFTIGRRHISAFEQMVHGVMMMLPITAVCLLIVLSSSLLVAQTWSLVQLPDSTNHVWLPFSYVALAGVMICEEWWRSYRATRFVGHQS